MPDFCSPNSLNLVVPLNPRADDRDVALDLKLRSGVDVPVHLAAFDGQTGLRRILCGGDGRPDFRYWRSDEGRRFTVAGYFPTEKVRLGKPITRAKSRWHLRTDGSPAGDGHDHALFRRVDRRPILDEEGMPIPFAPVGCDRGRHATADAQGRLSSRPSSRIKVQRLDGADAGTWKIGRPQRACSTSSPT